MHHSEFKIEPNRLTVQYFTVRTLLEEAYHLQDYQLRLSTADSPKNALKAIGLKLTPAHDPIKVLVVEGVGPVDEN